MITPHRPDVPPTSRYCAAEAARILGIRPATLRDYERRGLIRAKKGSTGRNLFTGLEILRLWSQHI